MRKKHVLLFILFSFIPLLLLGLFGLRTLTHEAERGYRQTLESSACLNAQSLNTFFTAYRGQLFTGLNLPLTMSVMEAMEASAPVAEEELGRLDSHLRQITPHLPFVEDILLLDGRGRIIAASGIRPGNALPPFYRNIQTIVTGTQWLSDLYHSPQREKLYFTVSSPLVRSGKQLGTLVHILNTDVFEVIRHNPRMFDTGRISLLDSLDQLVACSDPALQNKASSTTLRVENFPKPSGPGWTRYVSHGVERTGYYSPVPDTGWGVVSSMEEQETLRQTILFRRIFILLLLISVPYFGVTGWIVHRQFMGSLDAVRERINRFRRQNAQTPPDKDGDDVLSLAQGLDMLIEIINKNHRQNLESERQYYTALQMTNEQVFDVDLTHETVISNPAACADNVCESGSYTGLLDSLCFRLYPEDRESFLAHLQPDALRERFSRDAKQFSLEYRTMGPDGALKWHCCVVVPLKHDEGILRIILCIKNIHTDKTRELELLRRAEQDSLTHLYNKGTTRQLIEDVLQGGTDEKCHAFFIVDIDNFKAVNDILGHMFGDAVLCEVARHLQTTFRQSDIIGRIGGDEFLVCMRDVQNMDVVTRRADALVGFLNQLFDGALAEHKVSTSVGIALYPHDGLSFQILYKAADTALYASKSKGKNCWTFYSDARGRRIPPNGNRIGLLHDSSNQKNFRENLIEYIISILYHSKHTIKAISHVLALIGKHFNVSRVYVFEKRDDMMRWSNTIEWCNEGIVPRKGKLNQIPYSQFPYYETMFNDEGVFYCADVSTLPPDLREDLESQGVSSVLQCALLENDTPRGFIGFDEYNRNRIWKKQEVDELAFAAKIVGIFLLKTRSGAYNQAVHDAFEGMDAWVYIINIETYTVLYLNAKTRDTVAGAAIGDCCYKVFQGKQEPCRICPMRYLRTHPGERTSSSTIFNSYTGFWTRTTASRIVWTDGADACLVCCQDISRLMEGKGPEAASNDRDA